MQRQRIEPAVERVGMPQASNSSARAPARRCGHRGGGESPQRLAAAKQACSLATSARLTPGRRHDMCAPSLSRIEEPSMRRTVPLVLARRPACRCSRLRDDRRPARLCADARLGREARDRQPEPRGRGSPDRLALAVATFNPNVWYYISQKQETWAFLKPAMHRAERAAAHLQRVGPPAGDEEVRPADSQGHRDGVAHHADRRQGADRARADHGQRRPLQRPAPGDQSGRADRRRI
jgi:hypothetical protein